MTTKRDEMARVIQMSCRTRMSDETARHYADNLLRAGFGQEVAVEKSAAEVWSEAVEAVAVELETMMHNTWNGGNRRPSNYRAAAADVRRIPNPYTDTGIPARESEEWKALTDSAENLGKAVAEFQNAKDAYTTKYPKEARDQ